MFCPWAMAWGFGRTLYIRSNKRNEPWKSSHNLTLCDQFHLVGECPRMGLISNGCTHLHFHSRLLSNYRHLKMSNSTCVWETPLPPQALLTISDISLHASSLEDKLPFLISFHQDCFLDLRLFALKNEFTLPSQRMTAVYNGLWNARETQEIACHEPRGGKLWRAIMIVFTSDSPCWRAQRKKHGFFSSCAKRPSASYLSAFYRQGNNAAGDNDVLLSFKALSHTLLSDVFQWGMGCEVGVTDLPGPGRGNGLRRFSDLLRPPRQRTAWLRRQVKFTRSSSCHINPLHIF